MMLLLPSLYLAYPVYSFLPGLLSGTKKLITAVDMWPTKQSVTAGSSCMTATLRNWLTTIYGTILAYLGAVRWLGPCESLGHSLT